MSENDKRVSDFWKNLRYIFKLIDLYKKPTDDKK